MQNSKNSREDTGAFLCSGPLKNLKTTFCRKKSKFSLIIFSLQKGQGESDFRSYTCRKGQNNGSRVLHLASILLLVIAFLVYVRHPTMLRYDNKSRLVLSCAGNNIETVRSWCISSCSSCKCPDFQVFGFHEE